MNVSLILLTFSLILFFLLLNIILLVFSFVIKILFVLDFKLDIFEIVFILFKILLTS